MMWAYVATRDSGSLKNYYHINTNGNEQQPEINCSSSASSSSSLTRLLYQLVVEAL